MEPESLPDGGPAFPTDNEKQVGHQTWHYEGMTLRDYFAAAALTGVMEMISKGSHQPSPADKSGGASFIARSTYEIADEMIRARAAINQATKQGE